MARILIVEDERPIRNLIQRNLELIGHTCIGVGNGVDALEIMESERFDLLFFDIMLPGISGFELIGHADGTPTIFVTAKEGINDRLKGLSLGADDYIVKPFEMKELIARINAVLRRTEIPNDTQTNYTPVPTKDPGKGFGIAAMIMGLAVGVTYAGSIVIPIGPITISLSGLAVAAIVGIVMNAVLPGKDYEFGVNDQGDTSVNFGARND